MSYRSELIQSAAVIVSMIEDFDSGVANVSKSHTSAILTQIFEERQQQDDKWGPQHHSPELWLTILMEEVGEAAQAYLHEVEGEYTP